MKTCPIHLSIRRTIVIAAKKRAAHLSYRVAILRQSFNLLKAFSTSWRSKPKSQVLIHSPSRALLRNILRAMDQGSQFTSMDWASFLKGHNLIHFMSRRGNCHDNEVAESFFNLLKRERIRRKIYKTRKEARKDIFDYIEMFYNPNANMQKTGCCHP